MHFQEFLGAKLQDYGAGILVTQKELGEAYRASGENKLLQALRDAIEPAIQKKAIELGEAARNASGVEFAASKLIEYLKEVA